MTEATETKGIHPAKLLWNVMLAVTALFVIEIALFSQGLGGMFLAIFVLPALVLAISAILGLAYVCCRAIRYLRRRRARIEETRP